MASNDFRVFQKEFRRYQEKFGLTGYKVYFEQQPLTDCFATITIDRKDMVAKATLNSQRNPERHPAASAKHEAIHLLVNRLEDCALRRCVMEEDIGCAVEELTRKLEGLIP